MPASTKPGTKAVIVRLICEGLPLNRFQGFDGRRDVRVELQTKDGHEPGQPSGKDALCWLTEITIKPDAGEHPDFSGQAVHGKRGERFFYLSWSSEKSGHREMFRRIKIHLRLLSASQLANALKAGGTLVARVHAVAKDGGPACASVPILDGWIVQKR